MTADERPLVMISEGLADDGDYYGVAYPRPLLAAGAFPALLPYFDEPADRCEAISRADGLVLAGGRDIEPWRYGRAEPHPQQGQHSGRPRHYQRYSRRRPAGHFGELERGGSIRELAQHQLR